MGTSGRGTAPRGLTMLQGDGASTPIPMLQGWVQRAVWSERKWAPQRGLGGLPEGGGRRASRGLPHSWAEEGDQKDIPS